MSGYNRIAKNTGYLFIRMFIQMIISLYTSRLVLEVLGINNYGIYNVVGGLVAMVSYINQAMTSSTLRFITYAIGRNEEEQTQKVFNTAVCIHILICIIILILGETIGLWFFYEKLNIPEQSHHAALIIYQLSIASTIFSILTLPYNALVIAHERMSIFAYFSIIDTILKLGVVILLIYLPFDKLVLYGWMMFGIQLIYSSIYFIYCHGHFQESKFKLYFNKSITKEMISFASWSMFGCTAGITYTQGLNILINIFGGPAVNAARGLAVQVQHVVTNFVSNFQTAVNPQIIKLYATGQLDNLYQLIYLSAKYSFFLVYLIIVPLIMNVETVLHWWLKTVPSELPVFLSIILIITLVDSLSNPLMKSADASGKIKRYHIIVGCFLMLILPFCYIALKCGAPLHVVFLIHLLFSITALFVRLMILKSLIGIVPREYFKAVVIPIIKVLIVSIACIVVISYCEYPNKITELIFSSVLITLLNLIAMWYMGIPTHEKVMLVNKYRQLKNKFCIITK